MRPLHLASDNGYTCCEIPLRHPDSEPHIGVEFFTYRRMVGFMDRGVEICQWCWGPSPWIAVNGERIPDRSKYRLPTIWPAGEAEPEQLSLLEEPSPNV